MMWKLINYFNNYRSDHFDMSLKDEFGPQQKGQERQQELTAQRTRDNITIVDWGAVISKRSFKDKRIVADI